MDVGLLKEIKDYDGYMLMKFTPTYKFQQDFLDGKLYFNTSDFFSKCDDKGRGDHDEGNTFIVDYENPSFVSANLEKVGNKYAIVVRDYSKNPEEYKEGSIYEYSAAINRYRKVLSLYTMYVDLCNCKRSPFSKNMKKEFGEYGILILKRQEFFKRVCKALSSHKTFQHIQMGFVKYLSTKEQHGLIDWILL